MGVRQLLWVLLCVFCVSEAVGSVVQPLTLVLLLLLHTTSTRYLRCRAFAA